MNAYRYAEAIAYLFPNAAFGRDVLLRDDGKGPYIAAWKLTNTQPTDQEFQAALDALDARPAKTATEKVQAMLKRIGTDVTVDDLKAVVANVPTADQAVKATK